MPDAPVARVGPAAYRLYRKKAREFARSMDAALSVGDANAAASAASHCVISSSDALLAAFKRVRSKARDHSSVVQLLETSGVPGAPERAARVFDVIGLKQVAEYDDREVTRAQAEVAVKQARRFLEWAESHLEP